MATVKEMIEKLREHFVTGKNPQSYRDHTCLYRRNETAQDPVRCAAGIFIPDEIYNSSYEGDNIKGLIDRWPELISVLLPDDLYQELGIKFMKECQDLHDNYNFLNKMPFDEYMKRGLNAIEKKYLGAPDSGN